jgi:hypothetical protein
MTFSLIPCRRAGIALACALLALPAAADLTLMGRSAVASLGVPSMTQERLQLKKDHLRRDLIDRGRAYSYLFDFKAREIVVLDHAFRSAEVHSLAKVDAAKAKAPQNSVKMTLAKTGKQHAIRHWRCDEHSLQSDMATMLGQDAATFRMAGTVWLAANTPEQKEMAGLRKAAENSDFLLGLPSLAQMPNDQTRAIGDTIRQLADKGILCGMDVETRYEGSGRMVEVARKVATRFRIVYDDFSTDAVADATYAIPPGYQVIKK